MSATPTIGDKKCSNSPSREIASLRSQRQFIKQVDSSVGYFACAQYDVRSPIGTSCHFAYAADAPLLSLSRHFPRFSGGISPEGGSKVCFYCLCEQSEAISREGVSLRRHILLTLVVGYFANAQYDVLFFFLYSERSEESHRKSAEVYALSLKSWDISLALNMTRLTWGSVGKADDRGYTVKLFCIINTRRRSR